jgi:hypothetical protein
VPGGGTPPLTTELRDRLFGGSMEHFSSIATTNVLQLLEAPAMTEARSDQIVTEAARRSSPFLVVQHDLATRGGRSPVASTSVALVPGNGPTADRVWSRIASAMSGNPKRVDGQEVHRIVMIQEQYRFPLSGVPSIAGAEGVAAYLGKAVCNDFPTFWTRADVPWTKVSDAEVAAVGRAEEIVAAALLTGVARVEAGAILIPWEREFGGAPQRRLRATFRKAVRQVAEQGPDMDGASLSGAAEKLRQEVVAALRAAFAERGEGGAEERFERFVVKLFDEMVTTPPVVPLPDFPRGERLVPSSSGSSPASRPGSTNSSGCTPSARRSPPRCGAPRARRSRRAWWRRTTATSARRAAGCSGAMTRRPRSTAGAASRSPISTTARRTSGTWGPSGVAHPSRPLPVMPTDWLNGLIDVLRVTGRALITAEPQGYLVLAVIGALFLRGLAGLRRACSVLAGCWDQLEVHRGALQRWAIASSSDAAASEEAEAATETDPTVASEAFDVTCSASTPPTTLGVCWAWCTATGGWRHRTSPPSWPPSGPTSGPSSSGSGAPPIC